MDGWTLENSRWRVRVAAQGAELCEWWDKTRRSNRLWQPQAGVWNSSATQLFPVVGRLVHDLVTEKQGSISAEHGVGQLRRDELRHYKSPLEMELMLRIKQALKK